MSPGKPISKPGWEWLEIVVDGNDIIAPLTTATWFGGHDPEDDGRTASGVMNDGRDPHLMGCALPMKGEAWKNPVRSTVGSPLPRLPWGTRIFVTNKDREDIPPLSVELIDIGPAKNTHHGIDLTIPAFLSLGGELKAGTLPASYRIPGGAAYL